MRLTIDHPQSSYGLPVLVDQAGTAYGPADTLPDGTRAADWAVEHLADDPALSLFIASMPPDQRPKRQGRTGPLPRADRHLVKQAVSIRLPRWLIDWMDDQTDSRAVLIEKALRAHYKIKP